MDPECDDAPSTPSWACITSLKHSKTIDHESWKPLDFSRGMHFKKEKRERFGIFFNYEEYKVTFAYVGFEHSYNCRTNGFLGD